MSNDRDSVTHDIAKSQGHLWTCCIPESVISISNHNVTSLAFGDSHCLFVTAEGIVYSFGRGNYGQLGIGTLEDHLKDPCHVESLESKIRSVSCGQRNSAALSVNGDIYMWGDNSSKQCSAENELLTLPFHIEIHEQIDLCTKCVNETSSKVKFVQVACGGTHTLALSDSWEIWAWGCGPQLGLANLETVEKPTKIEFFKGRKILSISCGFAHSIALLQLNQDDETEAEPVCIKCGSETVSDSNESALDSNTKNEKVCPLGLFLSDPKSEEGGKENQESETISKEANSNGESAVLTSSISNENSQNDATAVNNLPVFAEESDLVGELENAQIPGWVKIDAQNNSDENTVVMRRTECAVEAKEEENAYVKGENAGGSNSEPSSPRKPRCISSLIDPQSAKEFLDRTLYPLNVREGSKRSQSYSESVAPFKLEQGSAVTKTNTSSFIKDLMSKMKTTVDKYSLMTSIRSGSSYSRDSTSSQDSFEIIDIESSLNNINTSPLSANTFAPMKRSNSYKSLLELKQLHRSKVSKPGNINNTMTNAAKKSKERKSSQHQVHGAKNAKKCPHSEIWTWGRGDFGQLGHGDDKDRSQPSCVKHLSGQNVVQVIAGKLHSLALTADGRVFSWGSNEFGQLGHSGLASCSTVPKLIEIPAHEMVWDVAAGATHSLFVADLRAPQVALYYSGCHSNKVELQCMCENIHKVQKLHILKKCGLVRTVFAGGPYSGCIVDRQGVGKVPTEHEFAASERKYLQQLKLIMRKIFRPLLKEGSFVEEPSPSFVQPMSHLIALWSELIDKVSMNAYDLTLLVQGRCSMETVYMLESKDEWIELYWNYLQALCNAISVNGPGACVKFMCLSPNMMNPVLKEVFNDSTTTQKSTMENFHLLICLPIKRIKEYINLLTRCAAISSKMQESNIHSALSEWQQLLEASNREKQLATVTCTFWNSVPQKLVDLYQQPSRRMILESRSCPLNLLSAGRFSSHWFALFSDIFMHCHFSAYESYPLQLVWVEPIPDSDNLQNAFSITLPEDTFTLMCRTSVEKTEWVCALNQAIKKTLSDAKHQSRKLGQSYDHRLTPPLARQAKYSFTKHPNLKDAVYSGTWLCGRLHGHGELTWPDGRKYVGNFKNNIQDGSGIYTVISPEGKTVYEGTWKEGKLNGLGCVRYPSGDVYEGYFKEGLRHGYGILKQGQFLSSAAMVYIGSWNNNKRQGYGVLDDIQKGEKYMGTWLEDCRSGNGIVVTIDGIYYEGTFIADKLSGFGVMIFEDNTWFEGELAPNGMLSGKGIMHLSNGDRIEGSFNGLWSEGIKVGGVYHKSTGTPPPTPDVIFGKSENLPRSFSHMSVPADVKWEVLFQHCKESLGIQNNNASMDNQHAWEAVAVAINQKKKEIAGRKKWHSLHDDSLDVLERIPRAGTEQSGITHESFKEIHDYLARACDCPYHPLGKLVANLVDVYRAAYLGVGANPRLLTHAVAEIQSFVKRLYKIVRVLFPGLPHENEPFMIPPRPDPESVGDSSLSLSDVSEIDGELITPSILLHPILLPRMYPPLFMLYALYNEKEDSQYWERLVKWNKQNDMALMAFLGVNLKFSIIDMKQEFSRGNAKALSSVKDASYLKAIETLQHISTTFTPLEKLKVLCQAFEEITKEVQSKLGNEFIWSMDDLFPVFQYVVVRARIRHLGSEIHLIENLMDEHLCYGELGIMCTTLKACYYQIKTEKLVFT